MGKQAEISNGHIERKEFATRLGDGIFRLFSERFVICDGSEFDFHRIQRGFHASLSDGGVEVGADYVGNQLSLWWKGVTRTIQHSVNIYHYEPDDDHEAVLRHILKGIEDSLAQLNPDVKFARFFRRFVWNIDMKTLGDDIGHGSFSFSGGKDDTDGAAAEEDGAEDSIDDASFGEPVDGELDDEEIGSSFDADFDEGEDEDVYGGEDDF